MALKFHHLVESLVLLHQEGSRVVELDDHFHDVYSADLLYHEDSWGEPEGWIEMGERTGDRRRRTTGRAL